jgi:hypothetical protein
LSDFRDNVVMKIIPLKNFFNFDHKRLSGE